MNELLRTLRGSVRVRITSVVMAVTAVAMAASGWVLLQAVERTQLGRISRQTEANLDETVDQLQAGVPPDAIALAGTETVGFVQVLGPTGPVLVAAPGVPDAVAAARADAIAEAQDESIALTQPRPGFELRYETVDDVDGGPFTVVVASPLDEVRRSLDAVERSLLVGLPLMVLLAGAVSWGVVGRALRPVESMRREVETVSGTTLHRRVPEPPADDEVARLARTMNAMLDRLERSADRQRRFVADASHELRSPVAALRAELEVAYRTGDATALRAAVAGALAEEARLEALLADLLALASLEETPPRADAAVDLAAITREEAAQPRRVPVAIDVDGACVIAGSAGELRRVVTNLLDNAARHADSRVDVTLRADDGTTTLIVDDDGPGIPVADRERVFERFVRLDEARGREDGGSGLGLALVRAVVDRHRGRVD
ncbi:MAG: ATP-binding protein, partial [Acidimicrobiales bacterium]